jgi:hypothetical protein
MALTAYRPEFPYKGNQVIVSSGRVLLHSKDDSIFLFGKKAVSVSTPGTFNVDANQGMTVTAPIIELGNNAMEQGEPVAKAETLIGQLNRLLDGIKDLSDGLKELKSEPEGFAAAVVLITSKAQLLSDTTTSIRGKLVTIASNVTFTN